MILEFNSIPVDDGEMWLLYAIVTDEPPIEVGVFEEDEIDRACERFSAEYRRKHLH